MSEIKESLTGRRIAGIDFGTKRIGIAVCDELHISVNPVRTIHTEKSSIFDEVRSTLLSERVSAVVIGMPDTYDGQKKDFHNKIKTFGNVIKNQLNLDVFYVDESFSSLQAASFMVNYGIKKKDRSKKGMLDQYAAVIILQQFLTELE
ncbi:MAG: Holliday junction resolvase RuvX [Candidatus Kapabacteria bacterium]|jgi:putative Holliday junction resolvase|nr:Holliday junction resolvase RuvX [Candidatus Kapabacteria bacterium]